MNLGRIQMSPRRMVFCDGKRKHCLRLDPKASPRPDDSEIVPIGFENSPVFDQFFLVKTADSPPSIIRASSLTDAISDNERHFGRSLGQVKWMGVAVRLVSIEY